MDIFRKEMEHNKTIDSSNLIDDNEHLNIFHLVGHLYHLPINGSKIRAQVNELKRVQHNCSRNREKIVTLPPDAASSSLTTQLKNIL